MGWVGDVQPPFRDIRRIAVLRGSGIGDLLQSLPAAEALAATYPDAELTLLGTPAHVALLTGRPSPYARLEALPLRPGIRDDGPGDPAAATAFVSRMRARHFDLAVQLHGGGRNSNRFLLELRARHTVGSRTPDAVPLERTRAFVYYQHEVLRGLEVVALAGAAPVSLEPSLPLTPGEQEQRRARRPAAPTVVLHPGASDPRRRWPAAAFARVAGALVRQGVRVVLVGDAEDVPTSEAILAGVADRTGLMHSVAGTQPLAGLVTQLLEADVLLGCDSGPRHVAAALGVATVGIYWAGNLVNAGPLGRARHRVQVGFTARCEVCGADLTQVGWTADRCAHDPSIVADVDPDRVLADVIELLAQSRGGTDGAAG
ncbi:glycosyltransferase family 9 protein [uncultured Friedmanniella sp.]|uniref:glycosyltransferase family 9 protein n=1 Tax=uncultured Friedmanniella sp. TaxID=335381 RepID=UPI0035C9F7C3